MLARRRHGMVLSNGNFYVAGGLSGYNVTSNFQINESFVDENDEFQENAWSKLPDMPTARYDLGLASLDLKIYAVGGLQVNTQECAVIEIFELETNQWTTLTHIPLSTLPIIADGFVGSCVVFSCKDKSLFELLAIDGGEDFEEVEELEKDLIDFNVRENSGVEVGAEASEHNNDGEEEDDDDGLF